MLSIDSEMLPVTRQKLIFKGCRAYTSLLLCFLISVNFSFAQEGSYSAQLHRADGNKIAFTFDWKAENGQNVWYIKNGSEKIRVDNFTSAGDSFFVEMPVFESHFRFVLSNKQISGVWIKKGSVRTQQLAFTASPGKNRFTPGGAASRNITGRWSVEFSNGKKTTGSVAEFMQKGNLLTGTFLSSTGDYRYLEGIVRKDSLYLSGFDGSHAVLFRAKIDDVNTISGGSLYSGATATEHWKATKDDSARLSNESVAMHVKPGHESLNFAFPDINGQMVSINSERFRNKVTIVQIMGS